MNTQFKKGVVEMCIMSLIDQRPMYGFEVIERLAQDIDANSNTIYPILRRLTAQGHFSTYQKRTSLGAPRKYYRITEAGKKRLNDYKKAWYAFLDGVHRIMGGPNHEG
ncbi:MAG: PadR family transcriptional regulator [Acholeplasmataceae bacterium]